MSRVRTIPVSSIDRYQRYRAVLYAHEFFSSTRPRYRPTAVRRPAAGVVNTTAARRPVVNTVSRIRRRPGALAYG